MQKLRLAILDMYDNTPNQGMRCIQEISQRFEGQIDYDVFDVRGTAQVPDLSYDIFISTGGPGSPLDGDGVWDKHYFDWLDKVYDWNRAGNQPKKYVIFICHSFQMACKHFEVGEVTERNSMSFGTFPVHMTDAGVAEPLFQGLTNPFWVADFRSWQVIQPDLGRLEEMGAEILALEKIRPHVPLERALMSIRFSPEMFGVQFHPEADPEGMIIHFNDPERKEKVISEHGEDKYYRMINDLGDTNKLKLTHDIILPQFLNRSIQFLAQELVVA